MNTHLLRTLSFLLLFISFHFLKEMGREPGAKGCRENRFSVPKITKQSKEANVTVDGTSVREVAGSNPGRTNIQGH